MTSARIGVAMLVHENLHRAAALANHWCAQDCAVAIHADRRVPRAELAGLRAALTRPDRVRFAPRHACEWGTFSLVAATNAAAETLLDAFPDVTHVLLSSGACLPLRPAAALAALLDAHPDTDFIQSVACEDVGWAIGGLNEERFTLRFPFAWKRQRRLFDGYVDLQRRVGFARGVPAEVAPHLGSQWWCLTRATLTRILTAPERARIDRYFRRVWIPDESYYQSLARRHARNIVSRSPTFARFDRHGRPHVLYDDHLDALRDRPEFLARKAWHGAEALYGAFLDRVDRLAWRAPPAHGAAPDTLDARCDAARARQRHGRPGLRAQHRFPRPGYERDRSHGPYTVLIGFDSAFEGAQGWLQEVAPGTTVHGRLFHPRQAAFAGGGATGPGALPAAARLRDYDSHGFLTGLLWTAQGRRQTMLAEIGDPVPLASLIRHDPNAHVLLLAGAWLLPLLDGDAGLPFDRLRKIAARLQREETAVLETLEDPHAALRARLEIVDLADLLAAPGEALRRAAEAQGGAAAAPWPSLRAPRDLTGAVERLRNSGIELPSAAAAARDPAAGWTGPRRAAGA